MSHTNGPWKYLCDHDDYTASVGKIVAWGGYMIAEISAEVPEDVRCGTARLIAAAPDLLEALKFMVDRFENLDGLIFSQRHAMDKARAAIALAESE